MENKLPPNLHYVSKYAALHTPKRRLHASGNTWGPAAGAAIVDARSFRRHA